MTISTSFLVVLACLGSGLSLLLSIVALFRSSSVPEIPKKVAGAAFNAEARTKALDERLTQHVKRDAGNKSAEVRAASAGNNGGEQVEMGDYGALEAQIFGEQQQQQGRF